MKRISFIFSCLFWLAAATDIYFTFSNDAAYRYVSKPLLMPLLILLLYAETGFANSFSKLLGCALLFSWAGDIILLFNNYFIWGLVFFMVAHLFYILYLLRIKGGRGILQFQPLFGLPIVVYWVILLAILNEFLDALKIPVFIYGTVICTVLIIAFNLFWKIDKRIAALFFFGSAQFVLSDSILAIQRFVYPFDILPVLVMITYCSAQFLLTLGGVKHFRLGTNA